MQAYQPTMKPSLRTANGRGHAISQERTPAIPRSEIVSALYGELWRSRRISKTHTGHSNDKESALHTPNCGGRTVSISQTPTRRITQRDRQHVEARLYLKDAHQAYHAAGDSEFRTANWRGQSRHITQQHSQRFKRQSVLPVRVFEKLPDPFAIPISENFFVQHTWCLGMRCDLSCSLCEALTISHRGMGP